MTDNLFMPRAGKKLKLIKINDYRLINGFRIQSQKIYTCIDIMDTCVSFPSLAGFVMETIFSDSEDRLFAVGLSVWQLK